jgi:predicted HNH restriction endonuclease
MVHHKVALRDGGKRLNPVNFMALCDNCHAIVEGRKYEVKFPNET